MPETFPISLGATPRPFSVERVDAARETRARAAADLAVRREAAGREFDALTAPPLFECQKCGKGLTFAEAPNHEHACTGSKCVRCDKWFNNEDDRRDVTCDDCRGEIGPQDDHWLDNPFPRADR